MAEAQPPASWAEVGRQLRHRAFDQLRLTKAELIQRSGISDKTLNRYLAGEPIRRRDKERNICAAVSWSPDSIELILDGGQPTAVNGQVPLSTNPDRLAVIEAALERIEGNVAKIFAELGQQRADLAAQWIEPDLSDPAEREIWEATAYTVREKLGHIALKRQAEAPGRRRRRHR